MEIAIFPTIEEARNILNLLSVNTNLTDVWYHIGGISLTPKSKTDWYWVTTGEHIDYEIPFGPGQPDHWLGVEMCMNIYRSPSNSQSNYFNDCPCSESTSDVKYPEYSFICEDKIWKP